MAAPNSFFDLSDPDPAKALAAYKVLRGKLVFYFRTRRALDPENMADEVIARAFHKLASGVELTRPLAHYCYGVARNVLAESKRDPLINDLNQELDAVAERAGPARIENEILAQQALRVLSTEDAQLVSEYYKGETGLAERLNLSRPNVRLRVFRAIEVVRARLGGRKLRETGTQMEESE